MHLSGTCRDCLNAGKDIGSAEATENLVVSSRIPSFHERKRKGLRDQLVARVFLSSLDRDPLNSRSNLTARIDKLV